MSPMASRVRGQGMSKVLPKLRLIRNSARCESSGSVQFANLVFDRRVMGFTCANFYCAE